MTCFLVNERVHNMSSCFGPYYLANLSNTRQPFSAAHVVLMCNSKLGVVGGRLSRYLHKHAIFNTNGGDLMHMEVCKREGISEMAGLGQSLGQNLGQSLA
jgi:hypothetical protein